MDTRFYGQDIVLENDRVKLIPVDERITDDLRMILHDEEITHYSGDRMKNEEDYENYMREMKQLRALKQGYPFIVIDKNRGGVAGTTRLGNIHFGNKRLEIGWTWYGSEYRGTGINKACKYELLKYVFETMNFNRVQFSVDQENARSQKAVLKLGATQEGVFRHNYVNADGESRDDVYFSIIRPEWKEIKERFFKEFLT